MISRRGFCVLLPGAATYLAHALEAQPVPDDLARSFANPPDSARPYVLWMWMGSNVSAAGITKDLEAMHAAGIGGATIFSLADSTVPWAGFIGNSPTPDVVTFTPPWWALVRHAASEAHRLGLELILHNCAGYESSGGPWITPELSMQEVVFSQTRVSGGTHFTAPLPRPTVDPHPHAQFPKVYMPSLGAIGIPIVEARNAYFKDIAALAVPATGPIPKASTLDLTAHMDAAGNIDWQAPAGDWLVYRFGHTTTGAMIQPAQWDAMGLECDKMNKEAVAFHVNHVLADMKTHLGDLMGKGITTLYFDSYEAGTPTWTPKMREEFLARRGYDLTPWLPILAGRTIEDAAQTDRFKADFKRTTHDLFRDHYWATPGPLAHAAGLKFNAEPYDGPWEIPEVVGFLDTPTVEFWTNKNKYYPVEVEPIVHTADTLGKTLVAAEAFTTDPSLAHWDETPAWLKPIGDAAFCDGINRLNLHHFVHQPWDDRYRPGNTMGQWGVHFGRLQTWWHPAKAWFTYLWRCQNLLQRGTHVPPSASTSAILTNITPSTPGAPSPEFKSVRRNLGDAAIFFLANISPNAGAVRAAFPVAGLQPELWDAVTGTQRDLLAFTQTATSTTLDLTFDPTESAFLVFRKPARKPAAPARNYPTYRPIATLEGPWTVAFDPTWGGPASTNFPTLTDWSLHPDPAIRFYSGTAIYRKTLPTLKASKVFLDLGLCHHIAEITLNGKPLGVLWTSPWRIDLTPALRPGANTLEIAVTNVWANRLIGDEQHPPDWVWQPGDPKLHTGEFMQALPEWFLHNQPRPTPARRTFTTWNYFTKDSPLTPSGLLGPVTLLTKA